MPEMSPLNEIPCWYWIVTIVVSLYHACRGYIGNRIVWNQKADRKLTDWQIVFVHSFHDALFNFICSLAGVAALFVVYKSLTVSAEGFDASEAALLVFGLSFGIFGVTGHLPPLIQRLIQQAKFPYTK